MPIGLFEDVGIIAGFVLLTAAAVMLAVRVRPTPMRLLRVVLEMSTALLLVAAFAHWALLVPLDAFRAGPPTLANIVLAAYSVCAIGLFFFTLAFSRPLHRLWTRFFVAALAAAGLAPAAFLVARQYGAGQPLASVVDAIVMSAFALLALAGVARMDPAYSASLEPTFLDPTPTWTGMAAPLLGLAGVVPLVWLAPVASAPGNGAAFGTFAVLIAGLITGRNIIVIEENRPLLDGQAASSRYETVIESSPSGIFVLDLDGKIVFANQAAAAIAGAYRKEDLIGRHELEFSDPDYPEHPNTAAKTRYFDEVARMGGRATSADSPTTAPYLTLQGRHIWVEQTVRPTIYEGRPAVLLQTVDITARVAAERASEEYQARLGALSSELLETAEHEQRRFAAALHDEVSQPLAICRMHLTAGISDGSIEGRHAEEALRLLDMAIAHTRGLTFQIAPPFLTDVGLGKALDRLAHDFATDYSLHVTVTGRIDEDALDQKARSALFRTTRELLHNVVKHACVREAEVILAQADGFVSVTVADQGVGLSRWANSLEPSHGFGLLSIQERLPRLGGDFEIGPGPNGGVRATARLPVKS
jgi:PAS domain S-box-containing protein